MKLITLNIWGGKIYQDLVEFVSEQAKDTDVFCFQEVFNGAERTKTDNLANHLKGVVTDMYSVLEKTLPNFKGFHAEAGKFDVGTIKASYGLAVFVRQGIEVEKQGFQEIFKLDEDLGLPDGMTVWNRLLQYITIPYGEVGLTIFNLHGLYTGGGKGDDAARLRQSERVKELMDSVAGPKILCGDFNLNPDTQSLAILEKGLVNLVKQNGVTSTRSHHYTKDLKWADYILVSPDLEIKHFEVLPNVVSDHLPLELEF
ncbi:MAG: endonuclease/exonuclease/phosphatase family protein [Patescibacteria group bacterium]|nr:endonuclease/exonuclease/phosphatase family protein [Patescibacteria group bacterium]